MDDFWGTAAWNQWSSEIHRALPEFPIVDVAADHPIRQTLFSITEVPQVPGVNVWLWTGGTSERGEDSPYADFRAIADDHGRVMVIMTHNTDISDSWEREAEDPRFFARFSPPGYALGINVVLYALHTDRARKTRRSDRMPHGVPVGMIRTGWGGRSP